MPFFASLLLGILAVLLSPRVAAMESAESFSTYTFVIEYGNLKQRAARGDRRALFQLANMYYVPPEGSGIGQNYKQAFELYLHAAMRGHRTAQHNVGAMFLNGDFVAQNTVEAVAWFSLAATNGDAAGARRKREFEGYLTDVGKTRAAKRASYLTRTIADMQRRKIFNATRVGFEIAPISQYSVPPDTR